MTTWSTAIVLVKEQLVGGPKMVVGTIEVIVGDTGGSIDLSAYFAKKITSIASLVLVTTGTSEILTSDITTVATTLTLTHTNPGQVGTIHFAVIGQ